MSAETRAGAEDPAPGMVDAVCLGDAGGSVGIAPCLAARRGTRPISKRRGRVVPNAAVRAWCSRTATTARRAAISREVARLGSEAISVRYRSVISTMVQRSVATSNADLLVFIERDGVAAAVVEFGGAGVGVVGHLLRVLEEPPLAEVDGDAGGAEAVIADLVSMPAARARRWTMRQALTRWTCAVERAGVPVRRAGRAGPWGRLDAGGRRCTHRGRLRACGGAGILLTLPPFSARRTHQRRPRDR